MLGANRLGALVHRRHRRRGLHVGRCWTWTELSAKTLNRVLRSGDGLLRYEDPNWAIFEKPVPPDGHVTVALDGTDPDMRQATVTMIVVHGWLMSWLIPGCARIRLDDVNRLVSVDADGGKNCFSLMELSYPLAHRRRQESCSILAPFSPHWFAARTGWEYVQLDDRYTLCQPRERSAPC